MLGSLPGKIYTLCAATEGARAEWVGRLQESMMLRQIDMESNRVSLVRYHMRDHALRYRDAAVQGVWADIGWLSGVLMV
jgi:hypothetical protein